MIAACEIAFSDSRLSVDERRPMLVTADIGDGPLAVDWDRSETLPLAKGGLLDAPQAGAAFAECPSAAAAEKNYREWEKALLQWLRKSQSVRLFRSSKYRLASSAGETEGEFRVRLQQLANEKRDDAVDQLRKRYGSKALVLENRLLRAEQAIQRAEPDEPGHQEHEPDDAPERPHAELNPQQEQQAGDDADDPVDGPDVTHKASLRCLGGR